MNSFNPIVETAVTTFLKGRPLTGEKVFTRNINENYYEYSDLRSGLFS